MQKFKILWIEHHNPLNWGDTEEEGIKAIKDYLPEGSDVHRDPIEQGDGWVECECEDYFEVKDIKEVKRYVEDNYDCDIYTVFKQGKDKKWTRCFTEEMFCKITKPIKSIAKRKEKR